MASPWKLQFFLSRTYIDINLKKQNATHMSYEYTCGKGDVEVDLKV